MQRTYRVISSPLILDKGHDEAGKRLSLLEKNSSRIRAEARTLFKGDGLYYDDDERRKECVRFVQQMGSLLCNSFLPAQEKARICTDRTGTPLFFENGLDLSSMQLQL